ncbi:MAG: PAS domain-containing protein [Magnetospirillum sp.]|nr:PAS domain-containing protein [Magnetospirillum sp.]
MTNPFPIVAIGASAGGVEALSALFRRLPPMPQAAFVVVTHLAPDRESLLPEILGRCTAMPVQTAADGQRIEGGRVYLNSPDATLTIRDRRVVLAPRDGERNPIDVLLASLAQDVGAEGIAAILSGTGSDGALGVKAVREEGGFTLAQGSDVTAPSHTDMPDAAIATGFVDCVLSVEALADRIAVHVRNMAEVGAAFGERIDEAARRGAAKDIYAALQVRTGHDFSHYKDKTFFRRIERRMQVRQCRDLAAYVQVVKTDPDEVTALFRDLLIGVTAFFRDRDAFEQLETLVIPHLFEHKGGGDTVRVWIPGCATGEECYSIAMLLAEAMDKIPVAPRVQIFATDVDERALAVARAGRYPRPLLEAVSPERLARFFIRVGETYTIVKPIRDLCVFSSHSIVRDPPFSRIDLVSCRNLLIYFNGDLQRRIIPQFHYALRPGGFLFLGVSENLSQHGELFAPVDKRLRVFRRCDPGPRPSAPSQPFSATTVTPFRVRGSHSPLDGVHVLERCMLDEFAPGHVLVDQDGQALHFSARAGRYCEVPAGAPSRDLLAVVRRGLRLPLRRALRQAQQSGARAVCRNVVYETEAGPQTVDVTVVPLGDSGAQPLWAVVFADVETGRNDERTGEDGRVSLDPDVGAAELERELQQTRQRLQISIEEYEGSTEELKAANEELLSVNEELQSSNEELETSKEELQSVNEELNTVNNELAAKVDELDRANSDLRNVFDSTRIATVFLDRQFLIRNFTPAMTEVFKLIPSDRGRPLSDIVSLIDCDGFEDDVRQVLADAATVERNVGRRDGSARYLMRVVPYLSTGGRAEGVIVTFVDVTDLVRAEEHQRLLVAELNHRVKNMLAVVASMATQMARRCRTVPEFAAGFVGRIQGLAKTHDILTLRSWVDVDLGELLAAELTALVGDPARIHLDGPAVPLQPRAATSLGIVIHELATNAVKYGALSNVSGTLSVEWVLSRRVPDRGLVVTWRETGGPPVAVPEHTGLGTELVQRCLEFELGGTGTIDYPPDGVVATLTVPATGQNIQAMKDDADGS